MTVTLDSVLAKAFEHFLAGDRSGALSAAEAALAAHPQSIEIHGFIGMLLCQQGDTAGGIPHLRKALDRWPDDVGTRVNLATALAATGVIDEVVSLCAAGPAQDARLRRLMGYALQQRGALSEAAASYEAVVAQVRNDFETWNNLGNVRTELGDVEGAIEAYEWALTYRPDMAVLYVNLSKSLARADRREDRLKVMREGVKYASDMPDIQLELGLAEAAMQDFPAAERAYRTAIRIAPTSVAAYVELGLLLENLNRIEDLAALIKEGRDNGVAGDEIDFVRAWLLRREGRLEEALRVAERVPESIDPVRRYQLLADLADRTGDADRAFTAYEAMNRAAADALPVPAGETDYSDDVAAVSGTITPAKIARWQPLNIDAAPPSPVILAGFPRSGTTLLDTLLMGNPALHVTEELPMMRQPEVLLGDAERIASIDTEEANRLRHRYFEALEHVAPPPRDGLVVVDKYPLHLARAPLIHRLFPDAKFILVERHPCDVVLSCFMANFQLNRAMRHMGTLESAARLYDMVFESWTKARALLPLDVHVVRYERMVEDLEDEMRSLIAFLGLPWNDAVLDNRTSASRRPHIRTASYSQVTEPIYSRAAGRWERYRVHMEPVLPILAPWAERMGYSM
ncbi:sulfotransferase [Sphingomonas sp. CGMCC 1.13654]|uniref:Sulfotransferase n=1 Tax=Sphingomonas chungangi TaxID=2683589 RepID=A0A838KZN0_9SPHN|nr:tetratricopeptide repeat-containing sulfotransferase family protein [Sphingomonas chungangi]MBA2932713.1 sulfotransferase [Sphingomonas chungangi]MVW56335.1 tetratricopeptide repeat protein [Sphingomonas chungangi]